MKKLITLAAFLFPFIVFAQTKTCTNGTLSIDLITSEKVYHKVSTPYIPVQPVASSSVHSSNQISLVKKSSDVDPNFTGIYTECFEATDKDGLKVQCCRNVYVVNQVPNAAVSAIESFQITVFPNPVKDKQLNIKLSKVISSENIDLALYDIMGKEIFTLSYPSNQSNLYIPLEAYSLKIGLYLLKVTQGNAELNKIIVLN